MSYIYTPPTSSLLLHRGTVMGTKNINHLLESGSDVIGLSEYFLMTNLVYGGPTLILSG